MGEYGGSMRSILILLLISIFLVGCQTTQKAVVKEEPKEGGEMDKEFDFTIERALLHDARAVYDTASFHFGDFESDQGSRWVLATVTPGPHSGSGMIPGAFIKGETGELVIPKGKSVVLVKEGKLKIIETTCEHMRYTGGSYSWSEPMEHDKRVLTPEDFYSPFADGGMILFRPKPGKSGIEQFRPVYLLHHIWGHYVAEAFTFIEHHKRLLGDGEIKQDDVNKLREFMSSDNKLITMLAFRRLVTSDRMITVLAHKQLARGGEELRPIITYLLLTSRKHSTKNPLVQTVIDLLKTSQGVNDIRPVVLGAFSASLFHSADSGILSHSKSVLKEAKQRLRELGVRLEKQPYLSLIFEKMGTEYIK